MSHATLCDREIGNTINLPPINGKLKKDFQCRIWCFTYNNYDKIKLLQLIQMFEKCTKYVFQEEDEGTPHLQGVARWKNPVRFSTLTKFNNKIHWEKTKSEKNSLAYCSDPEKRKGRIWSKNYSVLETLIDPMEGHDMHKWQEEIMTIIEKVPDPRKIHWYWEKTGNVGKSALCKHICMIRKDAIYVSGKTADIKYAIAEMLENKISPKVVLFDICRSFESQFNYEALESIKNGIFFSTKYESKMLMFNPPHIVIFSNWEPKEDAMSIDRWEITEIINNVVIKA